MHTLIALAGLAEAGEALSIMLWRGLMIASLVLSLWGFFRRSKKQAWIALGISAVVVGLVQPWWDFVAFPPVSDPDIHYWRGKWKAFSIELSIAFPVCLAIVIATLARAVEFKNRVKTNGADHADRSA